MKKTFFIVLYLSVIYMALNGNKVLASESSENVLRGILHFVVNEESTSVTVRIAEFDILMERKVDIVDRVYNTRKTDTAVISFSVDTREGTPFTISRVELLKT